MKSPFGDSAYQRILKKMGQQVEFSPEELEQVEFGETSPHTTLHTEGEDTFPQRLDQVEEDLVSVHEWIDYINNEMETIRIDLSTPSEPVVSDSPEQQPIEESDSSSWWQQFPSLADYHL